MNIGAVGKELFIPVVLTKLRLFEVEMLPVGPAFVFVLWHVANRRAPVIPPERASDMMTDAQLQTDTSLELDASSMIEDGGISSVLPLPENVEPTACGQMDVFTSSVTRPLNDEFADELSSKARQFERIFMG